MLIAPGSEVTLVIADPWDLLGPDGENRVAGHVEQAIQGRETADRDTVALRLAVPITYKGAEYDRVVLQARTGDPIIEPLAAGRTVEVSVYGVPIDNEPSSIDPKVWWRGGLGATASATLS